MNGLFINKRKKRDTKTSSKLQSNNSRAKIRKVSAGIAFLLKGQMSEGENRWYISPTYRQGKITVWPMLKSNYEVPAGWKINETELSCTQSGVTIAIKGSDASRFSYEAQSCINAYLMNMLIKSKACLKKLSILC
jgi:hypothetical protein